MSAAASVTEAVTEDVTDNQAVFRALMEAMARPGEVRVSGGIDAPAPLMPATAAIVRSLADYETPVWLDDALAAEPSVAAWIRFQTGAPVVDDPGQATFALVSDAADLPDFAVFSPGSADYPDRSVTLIVQVERFSGTAFVLTGPGIQTECSLAAEPLPDDFAGRCAGNRALFPCGIDLLLVAGDRVAALPRTVRVARKG
jgi:alpha-D-ribose 1-methylphosphonate 5-triphosphate synthase subunit PhnH